MEQRKFLPVINFKSFMEARFYKTYHRPTQAPKQPNYNKSASKYKSAPKIDPEEDEDNKAAIERGKKYGIGTDEHIERLRKMLQARDAKEEYLGEKILTSSRNLIGKRVTINNPKVASWHGRTGRVTKAYHNGYIAVKFRHVDHEVELHPSDIGKVHPGI